MPLPVISIAQMRAWEKATWATGQTEAEVIRRVGETVTAHALRLTRAGDLIVIVGRLEVTPEVGLVPCPVTSDIQLTLANDFIDYPPARAAATHKGTYGHLGIVAGSLGYHGAAVLAARGAQRAQPGLITLYTLEA